MKEVKKKHKEPGQPQRRNRQAKTTRTREREFPTKRRQEPRQDRSLPTQVPTNTKGRNPARHKRTKRVQPKAKATERRNRPPTRDQHTGAAGGAPDLGPNLPTARAGEGQTDMNRRTNHEGQPRLQTSKLTDAVDTAGHKHTHPKAREIKQG